MPVLASAFVAAILYVSDGDTLMVSGREKIRLAEIDAPETSQPWGYESKASLMQLCQRGSNAIVTPHGTDRYGRTIAHIQCQGKDASTEQVRTGNAWVYRQYSKNPELLRLESDARAAGIGLWSQPNPVEPWVWRHSGK